MKKNTLVKIIGSISLVSVSALALTGTAITSNNENTVVAASSTIKIDRTKEVKIKATSGKILSVTND
ncbi:hypothetical protein [Lactobacillus helveticus]|uniref:hypothetical protein n=1 Tax=Lactobacillus helveticus TaxID=1587 RepID=UPI0015623452|nr:hypothetical protein [Lactobacillus helveticus]NRN76267.1 hypothetical protein [Lactobacillus helveticus]NRO10154.1 hypothetical protein [Lactobacillus helveticus]NRO66142.1 hypothetical protein [Lactobacillus helveticus]